jgi:acetyl-CoA C-acetyltransferase
MSSAYPPVDPRTPVIVGAGQCVRRPGDPAPPIEPVDLMSEALRAAGADAGPTGSRLLAAADSVRVPRLISWRYRDPGRLAAQRAGADPAESWVTPISGNSVQTLVSRSGLDILAGRNDVVLITGAEAWRTRSAARRAGLDLGWTALSDQHTEATPFGEDVPLSSGAEVAAGLAEPLVFYPMVETALRAGAGRTVEEHQLHLGRFWSRFSEIAATNPNAWTRRAFTPAEVTEPSPDNRMVGFPYPKRMTSNMFVDMGAAVIVCSFERARALGIPADRWVFVHAGADAHDHWFASHRADLRSSPAIRLAGTAALDLAGAAAADVAHVDLYSCFPSAVQVAASELGLGLGRDLTVTGGMNFAGGPFNSYPMHSVATMVDRLRSDPGTLGLVTGNGGYLTKHAIGIYGSDPPAAGRFRHRDVQAEVDALPATAFDEKPEGPATIEAYTVVHGRDGEPERAVLALTMPDGRRAWGANTEPATLRDLCRHEGVGRAAHVTPGGDTSVI